MAREFYRIVRGGEPTIEDFQSLRALGRPLRNRALEREWATGVSVYDDFDVACRQSQKYNLRLGAYIVKLVVPEGTVEYKQTFEDEHHFTIYAEPDAILELVEGRAIRIPEASRK